MPHKRAKASIRKENSLRMGFDLPPGQELNHNKTRKKKKHQIGGPHEANNQVLPKNVFRILNAEKIRAEYKMRKNLSIESSSKSTAPNVFSPNQSNRTQALKKNKTKITSKLGDELKILPGEGLGSFNRRVEETLRPTVTAAMKAARKHQSVPNHDLKSKGSSSAEADQGRSKANSETEEDKKTTTKPTKDFAPRPSKFPITDTVMEPPTLKLTKSMKKVPSTTNQAPLPISSAQKRIMELERDKAIKRYRQMKEERNAQD